MSPGVVVGNALRRPVLVAAALAGVALLGAGASGSGLVAAAARAAGVLALLAAVAALVSRRPASSAEAPSLSLDGRQALGRDCGVAVVRFDGRRFLVGYGTAGAQVLAELSREAAP